MGSDPSGKICRAISVYLEDGEVALRGTFIIDPDGKLVAMDVHDNSIGRSAREILRKLKASHWARDHSGEVCPAE